LRAKNLRNTEYKTMYVVPDLTKMQQDHDRLLRDKLKVIRTDGKGDAKIVKGQIVSQEGEEIQVLFTPKN